VTRREKLARTLAIAAKRLGNAKELLSQTRYEYNQALLLLCEEWEPRIKEED
jgi:hypothetical protein